MILPPYKGILLFSKIGNMKKKGREEKTIQKMPAEETEDYMRMIRCILLIVIRLAVQVRFY
jgi:hypothetical protein